MIKLVNNVKTAVLLGALFGLILLAGQLLGGTQGLIIAFFLGGAMNLGSFFFSDKIAVTAMRGKQVDEQSAPNLIAIVRRLSQNANLPMPKVYICPQDAPNAFATGRSPSHAAVAVTQGALRLLNDYELEGVLAHELAHVKNRDTLTSTIAATIAGTISFLGWIFMFGGGNRDVHPVVMIGFLILAPLAAAVIQMSISRSREYVADHDGAKIAGTPNGLISALQKLEAGNKQIPMNSMPSANHMFIMHPLTGGGGFSKLFMSHPPTKQRIAKLQQLA